MLMNNKIFDYLDDAAEEYKELLLKKLMEDSRDVGDITVNNLVIIDEKIKVSLRNKLENRYSRFQLLGLLYAFSGLMLLLISFVYNSDYLYSRDSIFVITSIVLIFLGVYIYLFTLLSKNLKLRRRYNLEKSDVSLDSLIISQYRRLEYILKKCISNATEKSIQIALMELKDKKIITEEELIFLRDFIGLRNHFVHYRNDAVDYYNSFKVIFRAEEVINRLEKEI
ncbi:Uncharacterised protein [Streptococcus pneumoniae]|nr:Uncharacterised protein [Streptococcus pneumoniae]